MMAAQAMMRRSQASANDSPAPAAGPGRAASVGFGILNRAPALVERGEEIRRTGVQGGESHQCFSIYVAQTKIIHFAVDSPLCSPYLGRVVS